MTSALAQIQRNFIDTLNQGPDALDQSLFSGPIDRILLGLKAHANSISHARLTALEDSFPRTRAALNDGAFNRISRYYVETAAARAADNNGIGAGFAAFLETEQQDAAIVDLAKIEWAWLESYHAAEGDAISIDDIASMDETRLLAQKVSAHPAARMIILSAPLHGQLDELTEISATPYALLISRAEADVRLLPIDAVTARLFETSYDAISVSNLLTLSAELHPETDDPSAPLLLLLQAGALVWKG